MQKKAKYGKVAKNARNGNNARNAKIADIFKIESWAKNANSSKKTEISKNARKA